LIDRNRIVAAIATACAGLALASAAEAVDLRSWDMKINDVTKRFIVLATFNSEAVLDKETQLVWQRSPSATLTTQIQAKTFCADRVIAGRRGWRLPSIQELSSLADPMKPNGVLALTFGHPFKGVKLNGYWSATRYINYTGATSDSAYGINFQGGGNSFTLSALSSLNYWCVRGGGPMSEY